jgi:hypothetical protein
VKDGEPRAEAGKIRSKGGTSLMTISTRNDRVALALHREIAERLRVEPVFVISRALRNVPRKRERAVGGSLTAIDRWESLLRDTDIDGLRHVFLAEDEDSRMMRNSTVFQGVLSQEDRSRVIAAVPRAS